MTNDVSIAKELRMHRALRSTAAALSLTAVSTQALATPNWITRLKPTAMLEGTPERQFSLSARMAHFHVPAVSVAVIDQCKVVQTYVSGKRASGGASINPNTQFQAASISKAVTAAAAMRMVETGKLSLDSDLRHAIVGWTPTGPGADTTVTLRHLLSHTGGISVHGFEGYEIGSPLPSLPQLLRGDPPANNKPVIMEGRPGAEFRYSGGGYTLVQALMTQRANAEFPTLMHDLVLRPAGMSHSAFKAPTASSLAALGHDKRGVQISGGWKVHPELAAAGLWSTPTDFAKFAIELMKSDRGSSGKLLLQTRTAKQMLTPQPLGTWGLGVEVREKGGKPVFMHTGENAGYLSILLGFPETCSGMIVMMNGDGGSGLLKEVVHAISHERGWPEVIEPVRLKALNDDQALAVAGRYAIQNSPLTFNIKRSADGNTELMLPDGRGGRVVIDKTSRILVVDPDLNPIAALQPGSDATMAVLFGGRTFNARKLN